MTTPPQAVEIPGAKHLHSGKVRDLYELESGDLLMVASDRMSAFDWILSTPIPDKGKVLTAMSLWWFEQLNVPNVVGPWAAFAATNPATVRSSASSQVAGRSSPPFVSRTRGWVSLT